VLTTTEPANRAMGALIAATAQAHALTLVTRIRPTSRAPSPGCWIPGTPEIRLPHAISAGSPTAASTDAVGVRSRAARCSPTMSAVGRTERQAQTDAH